MARPCPSEDHDFRRVYAADLRGEVRTRAEGTVLAVLCCKCGRSPIALIRDVNDRPNGVYKVQGDWPFTHKITNYYNDDQEGPSVEFTIEEEASA